MQNAGKRRIVNGDSPDPKKQRTGIIVSDPDVILSQMVLSQQDISSQMQTPHLEFNGSLKGTYWAICYNVVGKDGSDSLLWYGCVVSDFTYEPKRHHVAFHDTSNQWEDLQDLYTSGNAMYHDGIRWWRFDPSEECQYPSSRTDLPKDFLGGVKNWDEDDHDIRPLSEIRPIRWIHW